MSATASDRAKQYLRREGDVTTLNAFAPITGQAAEIAVGDKVRFDAHNGPYWWTVQDRDDRYIVATAQRPFRPKGELQYTVVDLTGWQNHHYNGAGNGVVRSSLDTLGGGWDIAADGKGAEEILPALRSGEWELSQRRVVNVRSIQRKAAQ